MTQRLFPFLMSFPPIVLVSVNFCNAHRWVSHIDKVRRLTSFPRVYRDFDIKDGIGVFLPTGLYGDVDDCMMSGDFRVLDVLLRINGFYLSRELEGVLTYFPLSYQPNGYVYDYAEYDWVANPDMGTEFFFL